ncbi:Cytidylyltransferase-like [seawater metagenome]|uniref:ethanolamine-phosphate cytidylyltransferase n=1 Tax=seawater metagenome TaxID=1561972 RepID=A0A5E8CI72_9ZZZZ
MIVYVDMVADLFHSGHITFFKKIKKIYPDSNLYVGLMSDEDATHYKRKPILNINERKTCVEACRYVEKVFVNAPMPITKNFILENKIEYVIHGDDIKEASRNYWYKIPLEMKIYKEIEYTQGTSTTDIINRITNTEKNKGRL